MASEDSTSNASSSVDPTGPAAPSAASAANGGRGPGGRRRARRWIDRHLWQIQPVRDVLLVLAVIALVQLGYRLSLVTVPILLALLLAYLFEPVVRRITRLPYTSRQGAAALLIVVVASLFLFVSSLAVIFGVAQAVEVTEIARDTARQVNTSLYADEEARRTEAYESLNPVVQRVVDLFREWRQLPEVMDPPEVLDLPEAPPGVDAPPPADDSATGAADGDVPDQGAAPEGAVVVERSEPGTVELALLDGLNRATAWASANTDAVAKRVIDTVWTLGGAVASGALSVFTFTFGLFLTGFFFFFISSSFPDVKRFFEGLIPDDKRERTIDLAQKMDAVIAGFVRGRLTIMLIQSVFFTIGYWAIGAPASLLLGVGVGILSVVPYLALIGVPVSITLMALNSDMEGFRAAWWWVVFAPIGVYWVGQALDDYVLTPLIQGKSTDLDTPTVLFASIAGGILGGFYGLLIAIPLAACLKILIRELVWPRFRAWVAGENADPLPLGDAGRDA